MAKNDFAAKRREAVIEACRERGLKITRPGRAYRIEGPGVSLRVIDLAYLDLDSLKPYYPGRVWTSTR